MKGLAAYQAILTRSLKKAKKVWKKSKYEIEDQAHNLRRWKEFDVGGLLR
jgi:hypothetical protein